MLRQRLLEALDSPLPLLFVEALPGSGKRTLVDQWLHQDLAAPREHRIVVDARKVSADRGHQLRLLWSTLQHRLGELPDLPEPPEPPDPGEDLVEVAVDLLGRVRRPLAIAVTTADLVHPQDFLLGLRLLEAGIRLLIVGFDVAHLAELARQHGVPHGTLDDRDLACHHGELVELLREAGVDTRPEVVAAIRAATHGHVGMVTALTSQPLDDTAAAHVQPDQALGAYVSRTIPGDWPPGIGDFCRSLVTLPRFTVREASLISRVPATPGYLYRMQWLGMGQMEWHPSLRERVFRWNEPIRRVVLNRLVESPGNGPVEWSERVAEAARA